MAFQMLAEGETGQYLSTILLDLQHLTQLFGMPDSVWETDRFSFEMRQRDGQFVCVFRGDGQEASLQCAIPDDPDERLRELHRKRACRRLCRQTCYELLRNVTGIRPPWGSMTGIRPTHLFYEALERGLGMDEAGAELVSTFDIAPEKAELLRETVATQLTLPPPGDGWADVYIGIPFCTTRCTYCSFSSGEIGDGSLVEPYLSALFAEMREGQRLLRDSGRRLRALYIGGGTPTALGEEAFQRLLDRTMECFPGAAEYTVEAGRPDTLTCGKLQAIRDRGMRRISINPQTMNDETLKRIGRAHTAEQVREAYALARSVGMGHINMDVIAGLPGEHLEDFARTMEAALSLHPESLTVHTLAIKRTSRLQIEKWPLPDGDETRRMVELGRETAAKLQMQPYYLYRQKYMAGNLENVGYALPGHACQYNVDIMEEHTHILAFGAGGISKRVFPEEGHIERQPNVSNIAVYLERYMEMAERKRALFLDDTAPSSQA